MAFVVYEKVKPTYLNEFSNTFTFTRDTNHIDFLLFVLDLETF
jgi:hypothetical protein